MNGCAACLAIVDQYTSEDKWQALIKTSEDMIPNCCWKGTMAFSLEKFVGQHRAAYVFLSQYVEHDNIECLDPPLQAAMALVHNDTDKMNDIAATAALILPHDPVTKKHASSYFWQRSCQC